MVITEQSPCKPPTTWNVHEHHEPTSNGVVFDSKDVEVEWPRIQRDAQACGHHARRNPASPRPDKENKETGDTWKASSRVGRPACLIDAAATPDAHVSVIWQR